MRRSVIIAFLVFLVVVLSAIVILSIGQSTESIAHRVSVNLSELIELQEDDMELFESELAVYTNPFAIAHDHTFGKRVFVNGSLVYWSNDKFYPEYSLLKDQDTLYIAEDDYGIWLVRRNEVVSDRSLVEIFSFINLLEKPPVNNQYLQNRLNASVFEAYEVSFTDQGNYTIEYEGDDLFRLNISTQNTELREKSAMLLLLFGSLLSWIFARYYLFGNNTSLANYVLLSALLIVLRLILYWYTSTSIELWDIFDPLYFTSGWFMPTLGDLLLNILLLLALITLTYWRLEILQQKLHQVNERIIHAVLIVLNLLFFHLVYHCGWSLLEHSQIELDISDSIVFDQLRVAAYLSLLLICFSALLVFSITQRVVVMDKVPRSFQYILIAIFGAIFIGITPNDHALVYVSLVLTIWFVADYWRLNKSIVRLRYQTFIFLVVVFTALSLIVAFSIYKHYEKDDLVAKQKFANRLLIRNDILGEFYLSQIREEIAEDRYIRTRLMSKVLARQNIREKVKRQFLSAYFKKYDIDVLLFDADGHSLQEDQTNRTYQQWVDQFQQEQLSTDYDGIYFVEDREENVRNKYICFIDISAYSRKVGHIVLSLTLKKYIPDSVFPELLLESKYYGGGQNEFDYAVFQNGEVLYKQGRVSLESTLDAKDFAGEKLYGKGLERDGYHFFGLRTHDGRIVVIVSPTYRLQSFLANTSFVFLLLIFTVGFVFIIARFTTPRVTFNLSTKIQLYLGLSFLLPMMIVSIALINTLNTSYKEEIDRNFQKRSFNIAENLIDASEEFFSNRINIDEYANNIVKAASVAQSDLNIYDEKGKLVATSQPEIFRLGLLSGLLNPKAYNQIKNKREQNIIADASIGKLDFKTSYTALRSYKDGHLLGFLGMPYFNSKNHLHRQQVEVFNNLVVIFSMIFMAFLLGGNFIVGELVKPLKKIGEKLRQTSLQETNQPILYDAQDEIGSLVKEYNTMLIKLEESKEALAASQKESAWKEIARQVAHEIKNPLTPMRLKVQQMMRNFEPDGKLYKNCESLINQVDSLSSIADSFSEFAKMPAPNNERVEVVSLINRTIDLYQSSEVRLKKYYQVKEIFVYLDPKIFSRTITNILLNAIQSQEQTREPHVDITIKISNEKVLILIADKGHGIGEEEREKIFTPYFSTKSKGSGIGLAVAKKSIENAGGNIWFESEEGKGTTFYISLPVYKD